MSCAFCGSDNPSLSQFCRACGAELPRLSSSGQASTDALPVGTLLASTYKVESVLGQGGFGITYCCHDQMLDRKVAIKEFFPSGCRREDAMVQPSRGLSDGHFNEARSQFLAEARLLARCHHAGIVSVYTAFEANATAYMVMELLHGSHLGQFLENRGGRLSEVEALPLIERAGEALQFVHDKGLLHRDIKPENIIVCDDGRVMLIDFGTAREFAQGQAQGHTIVVTPGYAPLEQYARQARRGAFTDVYGLAATFYHLLTGNAPPAASDRAVGVQLRPIKEENPHISHAVACAIEAGLEMEIAKRPQSVREFLELLHAPAPQAVEDTALEVALAPHEDETPNVQRDALRAFSSAPPTFLSGALQARQVMLNEILAHSQPEHPVELAPLLAPQPIISPPVASSVSAVPLVSNSGGVLTKPTSTVNNSGFFALWWLGGSMLVGLGLLFLVVSTTRTSNNPSPSVRYSPPGYSSTYRTTYPTFPSSTTLYPPAIGAAARQELDSTPAILPVSVETLPSGPKVPVGNSNLETPNVLRQGLAEFSPDGELVAYLDKEAVLRVWSLSKRRVVSSLPQSKSNPPVFIHFSPDAQNLVLTHQDQGPRKASNKVTVWSLSTQKSQGTFSVDPTKEWLAGHAMLPNGKILISKSNLGENRQRYFLWDPRTGETSSAAMKETTGVLSQIFPAGGPDVVTGDEKGQIRWWDARTGALKAERSTKPAKTNFQNAPSSPADVSSETNSASQNPVDLVRFSRNGSYLASLNSKQIRVFDSKARETGVLTIDSPSNFAVSSDGKLVVSGGPWRSWGTSDYSALNTLWNVNSQQKIRLQGSSGRPNAWSFSPDGKQIFGISSSPQGVSLITWRTDAKPVAKPTALFSTPQITPISLLSAPSRLSKAFSMSLPNRLSAKQTDERLEIRRFDGPLLTSLNVGESPLTEIAFSPDGRFLSCNASNRKPQIWNLQTGKKVAQLAPLGQMEGQVTESRWSALFSNSLMFSRDNSLLARAGTVQGKKLVEVWSLKGTPRRIATLPLSRPLTAFNFSPDNRYLICGEASGTLRLYNLATQKIMAEAKNGPDLISHLVWTEKNLAVVSMVTGGKLVPSVTLYDLPFSKTGSPPNQKQPDFRKKGQVVMGDIQGPQSPPGSPVAISPDGLFAATARSIGPMTREVVVWHLPSGSSTQRLPIQMSDGTRSPSDFFLVSVLAFSPDGSQLNGFVRELRSSQQQVMSWKRPQRGEESR